MKKQIFTAMTMLALLINVVVTAQAQSGDRMRANIPFDFIVKDKHLPAGEYTVERVRFGASEVMKIQSLDGQVSAMAQAYMAGSGKYQKDGKLVFYGYGDQRVLAHVWTAGDQEKYTLKFRADDELIKSTAASTRQTITVAAQRH